MSISSESRAMDGHTIVAMKDARKGLNLLPSGIFGMTSGEFLPDFPRHDDFADQLC